MPPKPPLNPLVTSLTGGGGEPVEAVVLQGYLSTPEILKILEDVAAEAKGSIDDGCVKQVLALVRARFGPDPSRIYLSAKMDRWVDFDWEKDVIHVVPPDGRNLQTEDFSTTVWLKIPRDRDPKLQYKLVTSVALTPEDGFVRGKLVEDFMSDSGARVAWDEQGYAPVTAARSKMYCT